MTLHIFGYPGCTTVKNARIWAEANGLEAEYDHFSKLSDLRKQIAGWVEVAGMDAVFNAKAQTFRKLAPEEQAAITANDAARIDAMAHDPRLIKRPVATNGASVLAGFKEADWAAAFL
jgi:arsenate reductase